MNKPYTNKNTKERKEKTIKKAVVIKYNDFFYLIKYIFIFYLIDVIASDDAAPIKSCNFLSCADKAMKSLHDFLFSLNIPAKPRKSH